jgi:hypothetical protein
MGDTDEREMSHLSDGQWEVWHGLWLYTGRRYTLPFRQNQNLFLVVRLPVGLEIDLHEFNLTGRATDIDFAPSSTTWSLKSRYWQALTRTEASGLLIFI